MAEVDFNDDGSCWAEIGGGRKRWFPKNHRVSVALRDSLTLDKLRKEISSTDVLKGGYYQRTVYYRDEEGKVCIPPDPAMVPEGRERIEVKNLSEARALQREMTADLRGKFSNDWEVTEYLDRAQGDPLEVLRDTLRNPRSNYERDMIGCMLEALEQEEKNREVEAEATLHWMET